MQIPIAQPSLGSEEAEAVAVNSGTAALHAALLVPASTFFATASSVSMCGALPVSADVESAIATVDPADVDAKITPRTKAVVGVHHLVFIEDAAQAHGTEYHRQRTGSLGDLACFSFYATKNMATGDGGMVTYASEDDDARIRRIIDHGQAEKYLHTEFGYNYRMTDLAAAVGRVQLKKLEGFNRRRQENADYYRTHITAPGRTHVRHQYSIQVTDALPLSRDDLMAHLREQGIGCAVHYPVALSNQPLYAGAGACPTAEALVASVLSIPVHPNATDEGRAYICDAINGVA